MDMLSEPSVADACLLPYPAGQNDFPLGALAIALQIGLRPAQATEPLVEQGLRGIFAVSTPLRACRLRRACSQLIQYQGPPALPSPDVPTPTEPPIEFLTPGGIGLFPVRQVALVTAHPRQGGFQPAGLPQPVRGRQAGRPPGVTPEEFGETAQGIVREMRYAYEPGADRIQVDVIDHGKQRRTIFDQQRLVSALKDVPTLSHGTVEPIGERALQPLHPCRQIRLGRLQRRVIVVAHEHVGMQSPAVAPARLEQGRLEVRPCRTDREEILAIVATIENVVTGACELDARLPWHNSRLHRRREGCQEQCHKSQPDPFSPHGSAIPA